MIFSELHYTFTFNIPIIMNNILDNHFVPTAPSVNSKSYKHQQSSKSHHEKSQDQERDLGGLMVTPLIPSMDNTRKMMNISKNNQVRRYKQRTK